MKHSLLQPKKALDAVNEQLLNQTDQHDPRSEEWNSPYAAKGTEYDPNKTGAAATDSLDYIKLAEAIAGSLELLARLAPKDGDIKAFAEIGAPDLREFINDAKSQEKNKLLSKHMGRFRGSRKRAEIAMHEDPKILPPRNDMRSHLDQDVKKELDEDKEFKQV